MVKCTLYPNWQIKKGNQAHVVLINGDVIQYKGYRVGWDYLRKTNIPLPSESDITLKTVLAMNKAIMHKGCFDVVTWDGSIIAHVQNGKITAYIDMYTGLAQKGGTKCVFDAQKTDIKYDDKMGIYSIYQRSNSNVTDYRDVAVIRFRIWDTP